MKKDNKRVT